MALLALGMATEAGAVNTGATVPSAPNCFCTSTLFFSACFFTNAPPVFIPPRPPVISSDDDYIEALSVCRH